MSNFDVRPCFNPDIRGGGRQRFRCEHPPSLYARCQNAGPAFRVDLEN